MNCACMSVAKPGYSSVVMSRGAQCDFGARTRKQVSPSLLNFDAAGCELFDHGGEMLRRAVRELARRRR